MATFSKDFRVKHGLIVEANTHLNGNLQVDGTINGLNVNSQAVHTQAAFDQANSANILAQAAFNQANTGGGGVSGNIVVDSVTSNTYIAVPQSNITSKLAYANTAGANTLVDSFSCTQFRSVKYSVQITSPSGYQISELSLVQFDTNAIFSEYGVVCSNTSIESLGTFYANVSSNIVNLNFNGISQNNTLVLHGVYMANTGLGPAGGISLPPDLMNGSGTIDLMDGSETIDLSGTVVLPEDLSTGSASFDLSIDGSGIIDLNEIETIPEDLSAGPLGSIDLSEGSESIDLN